MGAILELTTEIRLQLLLGVSLMQGIETVLSQRRDIFSSNLRIWLKKLNAGQSLDSIYLVLPELTTTAARRSLIAVLQRGLSGSSIDNHLADLQNEFAFMLENSFQRKMQLLPLKLLIPLTLFILPAILLLVVGPLFISLMTKM